MQRAVTVLSGLGILLATGCQDGSDPTIANHLNLSLADTSTAIIGNVVNADSQSVARGRVLVYLVGTIPPDTTPPDSTPTDTTAASIFAEMFRSDSIPGDSTPPPPPPPTTCGDRGQLAARTRTNRNGTFQVLGLPAGVYDIRVQAEGQRGAVCGAMVREGQQVFVTVLVTPGNRTHP